MGVSEEYEAEVRGDHTLDSVERIVITLLANHMLTGASRSKLPELYKYGLLTGHVSVVDR